MKRVLTLLLIIVFVLVGCSAGQEANISEEEAYTPVEVETIKPMELYIENLMTAKVYADKEVFVIPLMAGKVERINVAVGKKVEKDQVLFVMDKDDIQKQVNQALAAYEAAKAGFDWDNQNGAFLKLNEEINELKIALSHNNLAEIEDEFGDVLFSCVNISRFIGVDSEEALKASTDKFITRFKIVEKLAEENDIDMNSSSIDELDALWDKAKEILKADNSAINGGN